MNSILNYKFSRPNDDEQPPDQCVDHQGRRYYPYIPSEGLVDAVNLAIDLQRPLLLEGEPGCGKTQLANALVYQLTQNNPGDAKEESWWPFYIWNVKSYTRARDGLYTFDAVERLRDAQMVGTNLVQMLTPQQMEIATEHLEEIQAIKEIQTKVIDSKKYRKFGALGKAIRQQGKRAVLLIDEVDKADSDFANDLLLELDQFRFDIPETREFNIVATKPPIVILTSNREKPLPDAFLRRCLYFNIEFPQGDYLEKIVQQRLKSRLNLDDSIAYDLYQRSLKVFEEVRNAMTVPGSKKPGTSEFLEFLQALVNQDTQRQQEILANAAEHLPFLGILLKTKADQELYLKVLKQRQIS